MHTSKHLMLCPKLVKLYHVLEMLSNKPHTFNAMSITFNAFRNFKTCSDEKKQH